ncbi:MAG: protein kinase [Longimicrobiales bacterium]|nr:protein kinase [Longimicrobiales bacterium]
MNERDTIMVDRLNAALEGRYRIDRELGEGGMATVYLAEDLRHHRNVALKVLKPELAAVVGAERFLAEIETTANLSHPNILPLFDSGEADGFLFYVMPYVEGDSLRDRLVKEKQLPVDETVRIATDVAEALDHAHRHGVIHRDVKPANILLQDGRPVVADFGIALAVSQAGGGRLTETGLSLGTPYYMSPEQATGDREVDPRSDVYALGCVIYEALAGEPPHTGSTAQAVLGRILMGEVDPPTVHRSAIPPNVEGAVMKALEKLPADRFASARELAEALRNPAFRYAGPGGAAARGTETPDRWRTPAVVLAVAVLLLAVGLAWSLRQRPEPAPVVRYALRLPPRGLAPVVGTRLAMAPDGSAVVYVASAGQEETQLWLHRRGELEATPIPGTEGARSPFMSPDGQQVGFVAAGAQQGLVVASLSGRPPQVLVQDGLVGSDGGSWSEDGYIYYDGLTAGGTRGIMRVSDRGGDPEQVTTVDTAAGETDHVWPRAVSDGGILFTVIRPGGFETADIAVSGPDTDGHELLVRGVAAWYLETGHLVYVTSDGVLMAVEYDPGSHRIAGDPAPVEAGLVVGANAAVDMGVSRGGRLAYFTGRSDAARREAVWVDRSGTVALADSAWGPTGLLTVRLSPDDRHIAFVTREAAGEKIWTKELDGGPVTLLTPWPRRSYRPVWSRDGQSIFFASNHQGGHWHARRVRADGSSPRADTVLVLESPIFEVLPPDDDGRVVFRAGDIGPNRADVGYAAGDSVVWALRSPANEFEVALSPDGRWLAYVAGFTGRAEVYVRPFPDVASRRVQVSANGGTAPAWGPDGRELYFRDGDGWMVAARVAAAPEFSVTSRTRLFDATAYRSDPTYRAYDVDSNGSRFLMIRPLLTDGSYEGSVVVVERWFEELNAVMEDR